MPSLVPSRWNSEYDSQIVVASQDLTKLNKLLVKLGIRVISSIEWVVLKGYLSVMKPLSIAIDVLQGEENCYMGKVLLTNITYTIS